ncbi:MAG TPA: efflux RND transporter periplasmic adaptor subunit [Gammaproteobacteria bacterium]|nr:efflux RND transporter periplasmic adaptor subunit [Gammaproteobacteria bacterium]
MKNIYQLLALTFLLWLPTQSFAKAQTVKTTPIKNEVVVQRVRTFGVLAPNVEEISFQIAGRILKFAVDEGDRVKTGQLLVQLQTEDAEDNLEKTRTQLDNMARVRARMEKLHEGGNIQLSQLEDIQAQHDQLKIAFDQAELNLARCYLKAPSDGIVLKQYIDSRTSVSPGQAIFVFQGDDELWVTKVDLTDRNALLMSTGADAEVTFSPYPNEIFKGRVRKVAQVANTKDGLYTAEVSILTQGKELRPGMVAEVDLIKNSDRPYSIVPFDALLDLRKIRGHVYLVDQAGAAAIEKAVTINSIDGDLVALEEDLSEFELVISQGLHGLRDGDAIRIQP